MGFPISSGRIPVESLTSTRVCFLQLSSFSGRGAKTFSSEQVSCCYNSKVAFTMHLIKTKPAAGNVFVQCRVGINGEYSVDSSLAKEFPTKTSSELSTSRSSMFRANKLCKNFTRKLFEVLLLKFTRHADTRKFVMHVLALCKHEFLIIFPEVSSRKAFNKISVDWNFRSRTCKWLLGPKTLKHQRDLIQSVKTRNLSASPSRHANWTRNDLLLHRRVKK